jgi:hypothetical protein
MIEAVSKVFLPRRYAEKAQSYAEIFFCILILCGSQRFPSADLSG